MTQIEVGVDIFMMESCINTAATSIETKHPADIGGLWKFPSLVIVDNFVKVGIYHHPKTFPVDEKGKISSWCPETETSEWRAGSKDI